MATTIEVTGRVINVSQGRDLQESNYYSLGRTAFDITLRYPRTYQSNGVCKLTKGYHRATLYMQGKGQASPIAPGMLVAATLSFSSYPTRENNPERDNEVYAHCSIESWREIELVDF